MKPKMAVTSIFLLVMSGLIIFVYLMPPHYYQARIHFFLHQEELTRLAKAFNRDSAMQYMEISASHSIQAFSEEGGEFILTEGEKAEYFDLLSAVNVSPVWRDSRGTIFYVGAARRFRKEFQIAYLLHETLPPDEQSCRKIRIQNRGRCLSPLGGKWSISYEWLDI